MTILDLSSENLLSRTCLLSALAISLLIFHSLKPSHTFYTRFQRRGRRILDLTPIHKIVETGYHEIIKFTERPFVVRWWADDILMMPQKYLKDVRSAGWQELSFFTSISNSLWLHKSVGEFYKVESSQHMVNVVKRGLNPHTAQLTPILKREIDFAYRTKIDTSLGWQEVKTMDFFADIAHRAATHVLIGEELSRDEGFLRKSRSFAESIFVTALIITKLPLGPFRSMLASPLSYLHGRKLQWCKNILRPLIIARLEEEKLGKKAPKRLDAIQWTLDLYPEYEQESHQDRFLTQLLHNLWAGSSAPGGMMTEIIWQLLLHDEDTEALRKEANEAVQQFGWSEKMLNSLHLQDSFIRETNRMFPTGSITCVRTVCDEPFQFFDGLTLPVGTRFGFPAQAIQHDQGALEKEASFEGFRHTRKNHEDTDDGTRWSATSVDTSYFPWGYGNHVCPGRFFAVKMMKMVITTLLLDYELKWDRKTHDRPPPINIEGQFIPNMNQKILLRKRSDS